MKTEMEHKFTSTGIKFWRHQNQMLMYKNKQPNTIISTHISPEGGCNLKCSYCSVSNRLIHNSIPLDVIKDYVEKLITVGLKAVIITGGGEPTLYKYINDLIHWLKYDKNLLVSLITNGTQSNRLDKESWNVLSWVRVSINLFNDWEEKINLPIHYLNENCMVGCSFIYSNENENILNKISNLANKLSAKYVRFLPNCIPENNILIKKHEELDVLLSKIDDQRFFHQNKIHLTPNCNTCHQSYFRPYLSEQLYYLNGKPGAVYPCDSVVLNTDDRKFIKKYQICYASDILDFLNRKITLKFDPSIDCKGCVFTNNINMLDDWINNKINKFDNYKEKIIHEEFI